MQSKSDDLHSDSDRLERLRCTIQGTWADVGREIGLSESMIYQVRSGVRKLSRKAQHRLFLAEREFLIPNDLGGLPVTSGAGQQKNYSGTLTEALALRENDPNAWADVFDAAVLQALVRFENLLKTSQSLTELSAEALKRMPADDQLAENLAKTIDETLAALNRCKRTHTDFFNAMTLLTHQIGDWLQAALDLGTSGKEKQP